MTVNLGDKVRDTITGQKGIAVARTVWLNGCIRVTVQPQKLTREGKTLDIETFDEVQLEVLELAAPKLVKPAAGPRPAPQRQPDPVR